MVALLAVAFLLQDSAADILKKVEEKYAGAKSYSVVAEATFSGRQDGKAIEGKTTGTFRSKGEGKVHVEFVASMNGQKAPKSTYISDGKALEVLANDIRRERKGHALALGTWSRRFLVRAGYIGSSASLYGAVIQPETVKLDNLYKVSDVKDGGRETVDGVEYRMVTFTLTSPDPAGQPMKCRLWIEPEKLTIFMRETTQESKTGNVTITETYKETKFDAEIADDQFKIP